MSKYSEMDHKAYAKSKKPPNCFSNRNAILYIHVQNSSCLALVFLF